MSAERKIVKLCEDYWMRTELVPLWDKVWRWIGEMVVDEVIVWGALAVRLLRCVELRYNRSKDVIERHNWKEMV